MKIKPKKNLFWFLKDGVNLDLSDTPTLEMFVQHVISYGGVEDIKFLLSHLHGDQLKTAFLNIKRFLRWEVKVFWEDYFENN